MKRLIKTSSVAVFLLALNANGFEFNIFGDMKAQYEQASKEVEERQKNPEEYEKKLRKEWEQDIKNVCTQATKLMAVKYTDSPEEIKAKYNNANKIIENVYKSFDALYKKQIQNIGYTDGGDTYYRKVKIVSPNTYLNSYLDITFDINGNIYYASIDGKPNGDIKIDSKYYIDSTYDIEPILEFYLYRIGGSYREQNKLQDAFNIAVKRLTSKYKNSLDNAYNTYQERKEKMVLNQLATENASSTNGTEIDIENMKFNSIAEKKAYIAQKEKETEEKEKAKEENKQNISDEWKRDIIDLNTKAFKLMAIKNTDSIETIEQKYKNREKIVDEVYKMFDTLYAKHKKLIVYDDKHDTMYYRRIKLYDDLNKVSNFLSTNNITNEINTDDYLSDTYSFEAISRHYFNRIINQFSNAKSEHDALLEAVTETDKKYDEALGKAFDTYEERQKQIEIDKWDKISMNDNDIKTIKDAGISYEEAKEWYSVDIQIGKYLQKLPDIKHYGITPQNLAEWQKESTDEMKMMYLLEYVINLAKLGITHSDIKLFLVYISTNGWTDLLNEAFETGIKTADEFEKFLVEQNKKLAEQKAKTDKACKLWLTKAQKKNATLKPGDTFATSTGKTLTVYAKYKDTVDVAYPINSGGTIVYLKESFNISSIIPYSELKSRPTPECGY